MKIEITTPAMEQVTTWKTLKFKKQVQKIALSEGGLSPHQVAILLKNGRFTITEYDKKISVQLDEEERNLLV